MCSFTKNLYKCLDPKNAEDCDIANITGCTACVSVINETSLAVSGENTNKKNNQINDRLNTYKNN